VPAIHEEIHPAGAPVGAGQGERSRADVMKLALTRLLA
jgi:hypothetical protein